MKTIFQKEVSRKENLPPEKQTELFNTHTLEAILEQVGKKIIKEKPGLSQGAYMGLLMNKFKGQVSGKEVADALKEVM